MCDKDGFGNITMCPQCDRYCDYWKLSDSCFNSKIAYLFDNSATVLWSIFMTIWGKKSALLGVAKYNFTEH